jgi:hypothetical protein
MVDDGSYCFNYCCGPNGPNSSAVVV